MRNVILVIKHEIARSVDVVALNCDICHENKHLGPRSLYTGVGGGGVPNMPAAMFLAQVDCVGCHTDYEAEALPQEFGEQTARPSTAGCVECHGNSGLEAYRSWKEQLGEAEAQTLTLIARAERTLSRMNPGMNPETSGYQALQQKLADAKYNYEFVHKGKGMHNVPYSLKLLDHARRIAGEIIAGTGAG